MIEERAAARAGRHRSQAAFGSLGTSNSAWFGAFHGLNALVVGAMDGNLFRTTAARRPPGQPVTQPGASSARHARGVAESPTSAPAGRPSR
jgi:hypothetical protein